MTTYCIQWLSPLVRSLVVATVLLTTLQPARSASAADCLVNEDIVAVQGTPRWDAIISPVQIPSTLASEDCGCGQTLYVTGRQFALDKGNYRGITILTTCFSPTPWKTSLLTQAILGSRSRVTSRMQPLTVSTVAYTSKKQGLTVRTILPELKHSTTYMPISTIIGPVQEFQNASPSNERSMTQAIPLILPMDKPSALFGDHPWGPLNQFQNLQRLPNGESHRMNLTTALALHGRDCVSDCP